MAVIAVVLALVHMVGVGHYVLTPWKRVLWIGGLVDGIAAPCAADKALDTVKNTLHGRTAQC